MGLLDFTPETQDIKAYAGDTATIEIRAPAEVTDGMVWSAQIRLDRAASTVDAEFVITPPVASGGPAYITLSSVDSARLAGFGTVVTKRSPDGSMRSIQQYSGVYDCQVSHAVDPDPVRTLVKGTVTVELDVTRPV